MGELTPIDPTHLSDRELSMALLRGVHQTHGCLEQHIKEQTKVNAEQSLANLEAAQKRVELQGTVLDLKDDVRELSVALGVKKPMAGDPRPKARASIGWKDAVKIGTTVGGSIAGVAAIWQLLHALHPQLVELGHALSTYLLSVKT